MASSFNGISQGLTGVKADPNNPNQLIPDPAHPATVVTAQNVRFIANTATATKVFNSPFGNVARNSLRDARTNTGNFSLYKDFKVKGRLNVTFHTTMTNVFNHPNFGSVVGEGGIDPFIDDAGLQQERTGFADPTLQDGGIRSIRFGLTFKF